LEVCVLLSLLVALLVSTLVTQAAVFATTIYLHRTVTHRSLVLHPAVAWIFRAWIWFTTGLVVRQWVAVHRKHHVFTDVKGDPHSPHVEGFWSVQIGNVFHYVRELRTPGLIEKYARDVRPDVWDRWIFDRGAIGPVLGTAALCAVLGVKWGLVAAAFHTFMYVFVLSASINGLCHYRGYRNFSNTATNIRLVAWLTGGEGLHNNHHGYPRSPKFSVRRDEFDPAWPIIRLLTGLGLARRQKIVDEQRSTAP
jgi:stearoyl-CoA desaturase (delta-9 desaturase)